jgi:ArsR family transcriptional regulator
LELLRKADLITQEKQGQYVIYSINTSILDDLLSWIIQFKLKKNTTNYEVQIEK